MIDNIAATIVVTATLAGSAGIATTWARFKTAIALTDVVSCITEVRTWLKQEPSFIPQVYITGWGGGLIVTELLINELHNVDGPHPPTYVLYDLPPDSNDTKYNSYGAKFISPSTKLQFFIPYALLSEDRNTRILIVGDWANTGNTLHATRDELIKMNFTQIRTLAVAASKKALMPQLHPDHVCFLVDNPWDKLPWPVLPNRF